jgi:hypothetical protein
MVSTHIGNELVLMIEGSKPLSVFAQEAGMSRPDAVPSGFDTAVSEGRIAAMTSRINPPGHFNHYFSRPSEAWRLVVMRAYDEEHAIVPGGGTLRLNRLEHQAFLGLMLGYDRDDTRSFVKRSALRMHESGELSSLDMAPYLEMAHDHGGTSVRMGGAADTGSIEGRIVLSTGLSLPLSVNPADQWRAKVIASALDGVTGWRYDPAARDVVARLLDWVVEPEGDEVDVLMKWAEHGP